MVEVWKEGGCYFEEKPKELEKNNMEPRIKENIFQKTRGCLEDTNTIHFISNKDTAIYFKLQCIRWKTNI